MSSKTSTWICSVGAAAVTAVAGFAVSVAAAATPAGTNESAVAEGGAAGPGDWRRFYDQTPYSRPAVEFGQQGPLDWPAAEMREVAFARARAVIAKYEAMRARQELAEHIARVKRQFERSDEFVSARQNEDEAWAAYRSAHDAVMARLDDNDEYRALVQLAADVGVRIQDVKLELADELSPPRRRGGIGAVPVSPVVFELAHSKLDYARRASAIRSAALANDPAVAEARARLQTSSARVREMRRDFDDRVRDDADVLALRRDLFDSRIASVAAAAYEDSARLVRRLAWEYSNYLHRNDSSPYYGSNYYDPFYGYGYGAGYSYGGAAVMPVGGYGFKRR